MEDLETPASSETSRDREETVAGQPADSVLPNEPISEPEATPEAVSPNEPISEPEATPEAASPNEPISEPEATPEAVSPNEPISEPLSVDEFLPAEPEPAAVSIEDAQLRAVIEAIVYVSEEPLTLAQLSAALHEPAERIRSILDQVVAEFEKPEHGVTVREVAGGFKMATKPEHHEAVRAFVKSLKPPLKLSLPALETLAVIAYKQPVTGPEIMEIRGVQGAGVLKTLLDRKLIAVAGRKNVIGKPMLYKTTKEFLIQFGLKDLAELPSLKEFEEIRRMAFTDDAPPPAAEPETAETAETAEAPGEPVEPVAEPEPEPLAVTPADPTPDERQG
jgi:segregation and condensation protein B